jgi:hypothetical protein
MIFYDERYTRCICGQQVTIVAAYPNGYRFHCYDYNSFVGKIEEHVGKTHPIVPDRLLLPTSTGRGKAT